jgi:hypothetical protein
MCQRRRPGPPGSNQISKTKNRPRGPPGGQGARRRPCPRLVARSRPARPSAPPAGLPVRPLHRPGPGHPACRTRFLNWFGARVRNRNEPRTGEPRTGLFAPAGVGGGRAFNPSPHPSPPSTLRKSKGFATHHSFVPPCGYARFLPLTLTL